MMRSLLLISIFNLLIITFSDAQINVYHVNSTTVAPTGVGLFYTLPQTVLKIDLLISSEENLKGPLADYAEKYFGFDDAIMYNYTSFKIEDISITTLTEPDPQQVYYVEMGARTSKEVLKPLLMELDKAGMLLSANNYDDKSFTTDNQDKQIFIYQPETENIEEMYDFFRSGKILSTTDTIIRRVTIDTTIVEKHFLRPRISEKSKDDQALETLEKIENIREAKLKLLTGYQETSYPEGTIKYMHRQLQELEDEYLDLFRGKRFSAVEAYTYFVTPKLESAKNSIPVFKFSQSTGVSPWRGTSGENVTLEIENNAYAGIANNFKLPKVGETNQKGLYYRIPGICDVSLVLEDGELYKGKFTINQLGTVKNLVSENFKVKFDTETGGLQEIMIK